MGLLHSVNQHIVRKPTESVGRIAERVMLTTLHDGPDQTRRRQLALTCLTKLQSKS